jgi:hypothetical protein
MSRALFGGNIALLSAGYRVARDFFCVYCGPADNSAIQTARAPPLGQLFIVSRRYSSMPSSGESQTRKEYLNNEVGDFALIGCSFDKRSIFRRHVVTVVNGWKFENGKSTEDGQLQSHQPRPFICAEE